MKRRQAGHVRSRFPAAHAATCPGLALPPRDPLLHSAALRRELADLLWLERREAAEEERLLWGLLSDL